MKIHFYFLINLLFSASLFSQSNFNIDLYKDFLSSHKNMEASELLNLHPTGLFKDNLNLNVEDALFYDSISIKYNLTDYEKSLIKKNGFVVSERLSHSSFGKVFLDVYHKDLPVFISTDAMLHAFHKSYDRIIMDVELSALIDKVSTLLNQLHSQLPQLENKYSSKPEMLQMLKDVDVYLTVPKKLLEENAAPYYSSNKGKVDSLYNKAMAAEGIEEETIFSDVGVIIDWSQFKPRGHYVNEQHPQLEKYFRTMIWLGRIEIYLLQPLNAILPDEDKLKLFENIKRQTVTSYLMLELFDLSNSWQIYNETEEILEYFIGKSDNVTITNLEYLKDAIQLQSADELLDSLTLVTFQDSLKRQSFANQLILSQILIQGNMNTPDSIVPASAFLLFGQRFVIDSYVTGSVVFDRIFYNGQKICRLFPSTLDPMFALGNNAAGQLLTTELEQYKYSSNLASLRYLIDSYDDDFWNSTIYNSWLGSIRKLNPPDDRTALPQFMQTAAFWQEKLNTQLSSWTQLRHDNLLYAKQSYTGGLTCSYPYSYVEPFPEFYKSIKDYASSAKIKFQNLPFSDDNLKSKILDYLQNLNGVMDTLESISSKILSSTSFSDKEVDFLKNFIFETLDSYLGKVYNGWYTKIFYRDDEFFHEGLFKKDHIVADIHTTPTDCGGNPMGWITHVGTGSVNMGVFVAEVPTGEKVAFVGPTLSYYEYTSENFLRLTDQEWDNQYLQSGLRPSWVNIYLADSVGNSRGNGLTLLTSLKDDPAKNIPESFLTAANYPNPFNPSTIISFTIPFDLSNNNVDLTIYNIQGEKIITLVNEVLPAGNYLTKWNGANSNGESVTSGIYLYNLKVADKQFSGKMTLIK